MLQQRWDDEDLRRADEPHGGEVKGFFWFYVLIVVALAALILSACTTVTGSAPCERWGPALATGGSVLGDATVPVWVCLDGLVP